MQGNKNALIRNGSGRKGYGVASGGGGCVGK